MTFNWEEYLDLAKYLLGQVVSPTLEAKLRAAVSRSYYAAFGYAREYAMNKMNFHPSNNPDEHGKVIHHYKTQGKRPQIASYLSDLRDWRNLCDYQDDALVSVQFVEGAIKRAQQVIDLLKN
jgi:uncharacterized protein (UPF0332 family)